MPSPKARAAAPWALTGCSAKANSSGVGQGSPAKGASAPWPQKAWHLSLSVIYIHTFLLFSLIPGVEATVLSLLWQLHCAELEKPQFSWAALLHDKVWALLYREWSTSYFLGTVFHNLNQILPWWPFPSGDGDSDATFLHRNVTAFVLAAPSTMPTMVFANFKRQSVLLVVSWQH